MHWLVQYANIQNSFSNSAAVIHAVKLFIDRYGYYVEMFDVITLNYSYFVKGMEY